MRYVLWFYLIDFVGFGLYLFFLKNSVCQLISRLWLLNGNFSLCGWFGIDIGGIECRYVQIVFELVCVIFVQFVNGKFGYSRLLFFEWFVCIVWQKLFDVYLLILFWLFGVMFGVYIVLNGVVIGRLFVNDLLLCMVWYVIQLLMCVRYLFFLISVVWLVGVVVMVVVLCSVLLFGYRIGMRVVVVMIVMVESVNRDLCFIVFVFFVLLWFVVVGEWSFY